MKKLNTNKLDKAAQASDTFKYIFKQRNKTPILDFLNENNWLKEKITYLPMKNRLGYEEASPELRAFIYAVNEYNGKSAEADKKISERNIFSLFFALCYSEWNKKLIIDSEDHKLLDKLKPDEFYKNIIFAVLNSDRSSFNKSFDLFEKFICSIEYLNYAPGICKKNDLYAMLEKINQLNYIQDFIDFLFNNKEMLPYQLVADYFTQSTKIIDEYLDNNLSLKHITVFGDESLLTKWKKISKDDKEKVNAFVANLVKVYKEELKNEIPLQNNRVDKLRKSFNEEMYLNVNALKEKSIFSWMKESIKAYIFSFKAEEGSELYVAEQELKEMQHNLKIIKSSRGYLYGFYYTAKLQKVISNSCYVNAEEQTNVYKATLIKPVSSFSDMFIYSPAKKVWGAICSIGSSIKKGFCWIGSKIKAGVSFIVNKVSSLRANSSVKVNDGSTKPESSNNMKDVQGGVPIVRDGNREEPVLTNGHSKTVG